MAISYGSASGWAGQQGNVITVTKPLGTTDGDLLVLFVASDSNEFHVTPPGFTLVSNAHNGTTFDRPNLSVFTKVASAEPTTYNVSMTGTYDKGIANVCRFTAATGTPTVDQVASSTGGFSTAMNGSAITPTQTSSMLIMVSANMSNLNDQSTTPPAGMTEVVDGAYYSLNCSLDYQALSGTTSTGTKTATASAAGYWSAITFNIYEGSAVVGGGGSGTASAITFSPTGTLSSTNVQTALAEAAADAVQKATVTQRGDLVAGTASGQVARLGVGADGQVLTAQSGQTTGLIWASPAGGGGATDLTQWTTYTPTVTANPTPPNLGTGAALTGHYKLYGKVLHLQIEVQVGTSPSVGSGAYNFSLPGGVTTANYNQSGSAWIIHASVGGNGGHYVGATLFLPATTTAVAFVLGPGASLGGANPQLSPAAAYTLGSGDTIVLNGTVEVQ